MILPAQAPSVFARAFADAHQRDTESARTMNLSSTRLHPGHLSIADTGRALAVLALLLGNILLPGPAAAAAPVHGMAMHGTPKYGPDFKHFDYARPDAPKGGEVRLSAIGTFDSLNPSF